MHAKPKCDHRKVSITRLHQKRNNGGITRMYTGELGKLSSNQILLTYNVTSASVQPVQHLGKTNFGFGGSGLESAPTNEYKLNF